MQVTRARAQYWLHEHVQDLAVSEPKTEFLCSVIGHTETGGHVHAHGQWVTEGRTPTQTSTSSPAMVKPKVVTPTPTLTDVMVYRLGSFNTYKMYLPQGIVASVGEDIKCFIHRISDKDNIGDYIFLPVQFDSTSIPTELFRNKNSNKAAETLGQ